MTIPPQKTGDLKPVVEAGKFPRSDLAGMFFISAALLALEICLTRIFSTMIWFHFSFLAIGIVMLGFAFAGIVLVLSPETGEKTATVTTAGLGFALACGMGVALILIFSALQPLSGKLADIGYRIVFAVLIISGFTAAFTFAGLAVATIIACRPYDISRIYCANLTGAGTGAILILPLLAKTGALNAMLLIILTTLLGALCFAHSHPGGLRWQKLACALAAVAVIITMTVTNDRTPFAESLLIRQDVTPAKRIFRKWNSFSCVDVYREDKRSPLYRESLWGLSRAYQGKMPELVKIIIDSWAVTAAYRLNGQTLELPFYDYLPANIAYSLLSRPKVLVLGAGGGVDILSALHYRAAAVTGVEINPAIVSLMKNELALFTGNLFNRSDIPIYAAEGRHWLSRDTGTYDLIHLSGVDSMSGALSGTYCFSESYLYTAQAFDEYLAHLNDDGIVSFLRFSFTPPMEMLRLFTTANEALSRKGIEAPGRHLMVIHSNVSLFAVLLMKKSPFTPEQVRTINTLCEERGFSILYSPGDHRESAFSAFIDSPDHDRFYSRYPLKIRPVTDNNPFFFYYSKLFSAFSPPSDAFLFYFIGPMVLLGGMMFVLILSPVFIALPPVIYRKRKAVLRRPFSTITYFVGIGIAFMLVENLFIQKLALFLGQPVYALALVLFCVLIFAGLGSYWYGRFPTAKRHTHLVRWVLPGVLLVTFFGSDLLFSALLKADLITRLIASTMLLFPCCFLMGVPFPWKIRMIERHSPEIVPWAWALNCYASVAGAFLAIISGITMGFVATCLMASVIYLLCGFLPEEGHKNFPDRTRVV